MRVTGPENSLRSRKGAQFEYLGNSFYRHKVNRAISGEINQIMIEQNQAVIGVDVDDPIPTGLTGLEQVGSLFQIGGQ